MKRHPGEEYEDLAEYADHLRASGAVGEQSIYQRLSYLRRLREAYGKPLIQLTAKEIEAWLAGLVISPSSRRTVLVYLRHALKVLNGGEDSKLAKRLPKPRRGSATASRIKTPEELLTEDEVKRIVAAFPSKDMAAITALMYGLGARPSDVLRLKRVEMKILQRDGSTYIEAQIPDSKGKPRVAYTAKPWVIQAVREWLKAHPGGELAFPSPRGGSRAEGAYCFAIKMAAERAGIDKRVYPYLLRHVRATELYDAPPAVRDAQMGWTGGSKMWANYTHLRTEEVRDAILEREGVEAVGAEVEASTKQLMADLLEIAQNPELATRLRDLMKLTRKEEEAVNG